MSATTRSQLLSFFGDACAAAAGEVVSSGFEPPRQLAPQLIAAAARMRLLPVVSWYVETTGLSMPEWFVEASLSVRAHNEAKNRRVVERIAPVLERVREDGTPVAVRKGPHLSAYYPEAGLRPYSDVDLFLPAGHWNAVQARFQEAGYRPLRYSRLQQAYFKVATNAIPGLEAPPGDDPRLTVDPSDTLLLPVISERWAQGANLTIEDTGTDAIASNGVVLSVLPRPYALVDIVANLYIGAVTMRYVNRLRFQRLTPYADVLCLSRRMSVDEWALFFSLVERLNLRVPLAFAYGNGERLFGNNRFLRYLEGSLPSIPVSLDDPILDEFGEFEFGSPVAWDEPLESRMFMDALPPSVPAWTSPI